MKKIKSGMGICLALILVLISFAGCADKKFTYSDGIDQKGFYKNVKALDFVELGDYLNMDIPKDVYFISDEAIQSQINAISANFITDNQTAEKSIPELTDEFVVKNLFPTYGYRTVEDMKAAIRSSMQSSALFDYIRKYLVENMTVKSMPASLVKYQENSLLKTYQDAADFYKMNLADYLRVYVRTSSTERLLEKNRDYINDNAKFSLIMQAIAEKQAISITDNDVAAYFKKHLETEDYEEAKDVYGLPYLRYITLQQFVMDYLVDSAVMA